MASVKAALKPFSLTFVQYGDKDVLGFLSAAVSLTPFFFFVSLSALFLFAASGHSLLLLTGLGLSDFANMGLKRLFSAPRPPGSDRTDFGMPSSHSQFAFFAAMYLFLVIRKRKPALWHLETLIGFLLASGVAGSRVYLGYHTLEQIAVGSAVGAAFGLIWFLVTQPLHPFAKRFATKMTVLLAQPRAGAAAIVKKGVEVDTVTTKVPSSKDLTGKKH